MQDIYRTNIITFLDQLVSLLLCSNVADKATVASTAIQYRRPEFYSTVSQCACVDNSTFETVMCKSLQAFVKVDEFLLASKLVTMF